MRRGDELVHKVHCSFYEEDGSLSKECRYRKYIDGCLEKIDGKKLLLITTGGSREGQNQSDVEWCQENFKDYNFIMSPARNDMEDFALMTKCDSNIVGLRSTFGWWAAFLNKTKDCNIFCVNLSPKLNGEKVPVGYWPDNFIAMEV